MHGKAFALTSIFLPPLVKKAHIVLGEITHLANQDSPPLFLCPHCKICEFRTNALPAQLMKTTSASLMALAGSR
jgi:hypothetical protein